MIGNAGIGVSSNKSRTNEWPAYRALDCLELRPSMASFWVYVDQGRKEEPSLGVERAVAKECRANCGRSCALCKTNSAKLQFPPWWLRAPQKVSCVDDDRRVSSMAQAQELTCEGCWRVESPLAWLSPTHAEDADQQRSGRESPWRGLVGGRKAVNRNGSAAKSKVAVTSSRRLAPAVVRPKLVSGWVSNAG